ncbi:HTTM domain-containing protein [Halomicrobium sp. LC1Hm]|uniref:HTTM domain-containing protein n=1 Tax=Halomicrobium sp. LC1Hm TaxID=2610902 RepID=UPI00129828FA|nr:HTTM domain-containing protein [Halomicrobium sp. LC1Hm]QGA83290.1 HTTM domain containing membrane enzyme [Halomicrobium sp. LC1Hm]
MSGRLVARASSDARQWFEQRFRVDTRALAALRIALGTILLLDVLLRARHLVAFYTDAGVLPTSTLRAVVGTPALLSVHALSGSVWLQICLFFAAGLAALALLVGYRTRLATLLSLALLLSLQIRNPFVLNGGDTLLRRLLFWSLFLPLGERLSVDATEVTETTPRRAVSGLATVGLLGQVVAVYAVNAVVKLRGDAWPSGRALALVFDLDHYTVLAGDLLAPVPLLPALLGWGWLTLLVASPLLVGLTGRARGALAGLFVAGHAGMLVTVWVGLFPLVSIAALLPFFPAFVWDRVWGGVPDGWDRGGASRLEDHAAATIPASVRRALGRLRRPLLVLVLAAMLVSNAATLGVAPVADADVPEQSWDMFAPAPPGVDGWFVAPGTTTDGREVDALAMAPLSWERPSNLERAYPSTRWRKYLLRLRSGDTEPRRAALAGSLCQRWNRTHERGLERVGLVFVAEPTRLDGPDPQRRKELGTYSCRSATEKGNSRVSPAPR